MSMLVFLQTILPFAAIVVLLILWGLTTSRRPKQFPQFKPDPGLAHRNMVRLSIREMEMSWRLK